MLEKVMQSFFRFTTPKRFDALNPDTPVSSSSPKLNSIWDLRPLVTAFLENTRRMVAQPATRGLTDLMISNRGCTLDSYLVPAVNDLLQGCDITLPLLSHSCARYAAECDTPFLTSCSAPEPYGRLTSL